MRRLLRRSFSQQLLPAFVPCPPARHAIAATGGGTPAGQRTERGHVAQNAVGVPNRGQTSAGLDIPYAQSTSAAHLQGALRLRILAVRPTPKLLHAGRTDAHAVRKRQIIARAKAAAARTKRRPWFKSTRPRTASSLRPERRGCAARQPASTSHSSTTQSSQPDASRRRVPLRTSVSAPTYAGNKRDKTCSRLDATIPSKGRRTARKTRRSRRCTRR